MNRPNRIRRQDLVKALADLSDDQFAEVVADARDPDRNAGRAFARWAESQFGRSAGGLETLGTIGPTHTAPSNRSEQFARAVDRMFTGPSQYDDQEQE
ncbi:hypothetical protein [Smaragdicoccus niigatensis]|uniref:hypothetical protein n=1 Tax=Smaragdicoccus niigatensis TaxID=359359 RepID=UPI00035D51C9|nr:hypothetical protein [Smaragdicoccus niigatensis]